MTRTFLVALLSLPPPAVAHVGHIADVARHGHWIALGAIGLAAAAALAAALAGKGKDKVDDPEDGKEAPA